MPRDATVREPRRAPPPLDFAALERLAITYVGRYATTRARLRTYLTRKLRERGWGGDEAAGGPGGAAEVDRLVERCVALGYVDDGQFAASRAVSLGRRGYGARRVGDALHAAGIEAPDAAPAVAAAQDAAWETALAFARRRRLGPFAPPSGDADQDRIRRRKALGAMLRAGHPMDIARKLIDAAPGTWDGEDDTGDGRFPPC